MLRTTKNMQLVYLSILKMRLIQSIMEYLLNKLKHYGARGVASDWVGLHCKNKRHLHVLLRDTCV